MMPKVQYIKEKNQTLLKFAFEFAIQKKFPPLRTSNNKQQTLGTFSPT